MRYPLIELVSDSSYSEWIKSAQLRGENKFITDVTHILHFAMPECSPLKLALECFNRVTCGDKIYRTSLHCHTRVSISGIHKCFGFQLKLVPETFYRVTCGNDSLIPTLGVWVRNLSFQEKVIAKEDGTTKKILLVCTVMTLLVGRVLRAEEAPSPVIPSLIPGTLF